MYSQVKHWRDGVNKLTGANCAGDAGLRTNTLNGFLIQDGCKCPPLQSLCLNSQYDTFTGTSPTPYVPGQRNSVEKVDY